MSRYCIEVEKKDSLHSPTLLEPQNIENILMLKFLIEKFSFVVKINISMNENDSREITPIEKM